MNRKTSKRINRYKRDFVGYMRKTYKNKLVAMTLFAIGIASTYLLNDGTVLAFFLIFGIPLFFTSEACITD